MELNTNKKKLRKLLGMNAFSKHKQDDNNIFIIHKRSNIIITNSEVKYKHFHFEIFGRRNSYFMLESEYLFLDKQMNLKFFDERENFMDAKTKLWLMDRMM